MQISQRCVIIKQVLKYMKGRGCILTSNTERIVARRQISPQRSQLQNYATELILSRFKINDYTPSLGQEAVEVFLRTAEKMQCLCEYNMRT